MFRNLAKKLVFQQLIFQRWIAERPFRLRKLTACRKKFAFLSARRHEVKAPDAEKSKIACNDPASIVIVQMAIIVAVASRSPVLPSIDNVLQEDLLPRRYPIGAKLRTVDSLPPCGGGLGWGVVPWGTACHLPRPPPPTPPHKGEGSSSRHRRALS